VAQKFVSAVAHFFAVNNAYTAPEVHADRATWCMTNAETVNRFR
jgi:hypothetical protein